jgi:hypothetical protein
MTLKLHLKRTTLGEKIGFTEEWIKDDLGESSTDQDATKDPVDKLYDLVISQIYTGTPLYDHNTLGKVYIRATN